MVPEFTFSPLSATLTSTVADIEAASYPEDEKATFDGIVKRQKEAGEYFFGAVNNTGCLVGFINGTRCDEFTEESMEEHDACGKYLAIHSVCVKEEYRRKGFATAMLKKYIDIMKSREKDNIEGLVLIAKKHLIGFYESCGFQCDGESAIVHGKDPWFDLRMNLVKD